MHLFTDDTVKKGMLKLAIKHSDAMISRICQHQDTSAKSKEIHIPYEIILWIVQNKTCSQTSPLHLYQSFILLDQNNLLM
jgi:hypothetical protein